MTHIRKVLVVGSKGFIGSHCVRAFQEEWDTWGCDVFTDYNEKNFFLVDTLSPAYHELFQQHTFDLCINCAGAASVSDSLRHPERDFELNVLLVYKLFEAIRRYNPGCKFVNISSAAVYGNPASQPVRETDALKPVSPYGLHKMYAEQIGQEFARYFSIQNCHVRIFSAYGPGLRKQLFWDLFQKSKAGKSLELFGTGKESRDYIFITDIIKALRILALHATFQGEAYNLASARSFAVEDVANRFFRILNWNGEVRFSGTKRAGDPDFWEADIGKLQAMGFRPECSIDEGLTKYAEWLRGLS